MTHPSFGLRLSAALLATSVFMACEPDDAGTQTPSATQPPAPTATAPDESSPTEPSTPTDAQTQALTPTAIPTPTAVPTPTAIPTPPPTPTAAPTPTAPPVYTAQIRYTSHGVPHVLADDLPSATFGQGYAFAKAHGCTLLDQIIKVRSERARYLGPGSGDSNIDSDFGFLHLRVMDNAADYLENGDPATLGAIHGFAAGFNHFIETEGTAALESWCANEAWAGPIDTHSLMAYYLSLAGLSSAAALIPGIARAQPPGSPTEVGPLPKMPDFRKLGLASNGLAIGGDVSASGRGMLAANPHFPWDGELRFFESQMTVPGVGNVYGASLLGSAAINIGFNEHVAWTHTVSAASRMTFYRLSLDRNDPTRYRYDGRFRDMTPTEYTIEVKGDDGSLSTLNRTLYNSHWGPIVATEEAGWGDFVALTLRDANNNNTGLLPQFFGMNLAEDLAAFEDVHRQVQGIPWVNTMAADDQGNALYVDGSAVPNLSADTIASWQEALEAGDPLTLLGASLGVPLLDGSTSANEWVESPQAARPGLVPYDEAPRLLRSDYAFNANDSHWLPHPEITLEGYSPLYGAERTPRSPRTRMNATMLQEIGSGAAGGDDGLLNRQELAALILDNRGMMAELLVDEVLTRCDGIPVPYNGGPVDVTPLCNAISGWDRRYNTDSEGAAAWREFIGAFDSASLTDAGSLFAVAFDPDNPVATPNTLAPATGSRASDPILQALAEAQTTLEAAGVAVDAALGDVQYTIKGGERIPVHGGNGSEGCFNIVTYTTSSVLITSTEDLIPRAGSVVHGSTDLTDEGYVINYGTSFIMALEFTDDGPQAQSFVTYSQDGREDSPYYADQTEAFSEKAWKQIRFTEAEITSDPNYSVITVSNAP